MSNANRLAKLRQAMGLSHAELAAKLEPSRGGRSLHERTIYRWEIGESSIPDERKAELSTLFGVSISFLMGWEAGDGNGHRQSFGRAA